MAVAIVDEDQDRPGDAIHRLTIEHRGALRKPTCCCGWAGVWRHRVAEVEKLYRQHHEGQEARLSGRKTKGVAQRRPLTPNADLPEELR